MKTKHPNILFQDYSPFGVTFSGRSWSGEEYRYGFNGKEKDNETFAGTYDFGARLLDSRLGGRFCSIDPLWHKFPGLSPYVFGLNSPIIFNDPDGKVSRLTIEKNSTGGGTITVKTTVHIYGPSASEELAKEAQDYFKPINDKPYTYVDSEGNSWLVQVQVTFQYSPALDAYANVVDDPEHPGENINDTTPWDLNCMQCNGPSVLDLIGYERGDNFQYVDESIKMDDGNVLDRTQYGGVQGTTVTSSPGILSHAAGHNLGFDDFRTGANIFGLSLIQDLGESNLILIGEKGVELSEDVKPGEMKTILFGGQFDNGVSPEDRKEIIDEQNARK